MSLRRKNHNLSTCRCYELDCNLTLQRQELASVIVVVIHVKRFIVDLYELGYQVGDGHASLLKHRHRERILELGLLRLHLGEAGDAFISLVRK